MTGLTNALSKPSTNDSKIQSTTPPVYEVDIWEDQHGDQKR